MEIVLDEFKSAEVSFPLIRISSAGNAFSAIVIHGFGGSKEEQLGLSFRIAELGLNVFTVDLRGHGQNSRVLDPGVVDDVAALVNSLKESGKVMTVGHSLGGRLSLLSNADFRVGISPALDTVFSDQTVTLITSLRGYRAVESEPGMNFEILKRLPPVDGLITENDLVLYAERDVPEIVSHCQVLKGKGKNVVRIPGALHNDIFLLESTFREIERLLRRIGFHSPLPSPAERDPFSKRD